MTARLCCLTLVFLQLDISLSFNEVLEMRTLTACEYRVELNVAGKFYCRHAKVHSRGNVVTPAICGSCTAQTEICAQPRPVPATLDVPVVTEPSLARKLWNVSQSIAAFVSDGMQLVNDQEYASRLAVCDSCEQRIGDRCGCCGCHLTLKATARAFKCPLGKWKHDASPNDSLTKDPVTQG